MGTYVVEGLRVLGLPDNRPGGVARDLCPIKCWHMGVRRVEQQAPNLVGHAAMHRVLGVGALLQLSQNG